MPTILLYIIVIISWGTSWLAIKYQIDVVAPTVSVAYRFLLAGAILTAYCILTRKTLRFTRADYFRIASQALFLFCLNYILIYFCSQYLVSGVVSVVFSTFAFMNIFNARIFLGQPLQRETIVASVLGFLGVAFVFKDEFSHIESLGNWTLGLALGLASAYLASIGNMISIKNKSRKLPLVQTTGLGMIFGGGVTFVIAMFIGEPITFSLTPAYVGSLLYLSIVASVIAFLSYLTLLSRLGAGKAAYSTFVFPVVAIALSIVFENYELNFANSFGIFLILIGNYIVLMKPNNQLWYGKFFQMLRPR